MSKIDKNYKYRSWGDVDWQQYLIRYYLRIKIQILIIILRKFWRRLFFNILINFRQKIKMMYNKNKMKIHKNQKNKNNKNNKNKESNKENNKNKKNKF